MGPNVPDPWEGARDSLHQAGVADPTNQQIAAVDYNAGRSFMQRMGERFSVDAWNERARHLWVGAKLYFTIPKR
jgi:hypothetical protein